MASSEEQLTDRVTASLPDLRGFADQIGSLGQFVAGTPQLLPDAVASRVVVDGGQLCGSLRQFVGQFRAVLDAGQQACLRLGGGLAELAAQPQHVATGYSTTSEAIVDWSRGLDPGCYRIQDSASYPRMAYADLIVQADEGLRTTIEGDGCSSVNDVLRQLTGIDAAKEFIRPFLGDWGFLYATRDALARSGEAADDACLLLAESTGRLVANAWTGKAATGFAEYSSCYQSELNALADHFASASAELGNTASLIDKTGQRITEAILAATGVALELYTRNPTKFGKNVIDLIFFGDIVDLVETAAERVNGLIRVLDATGTQTTELCAQAEGLQPPRMPS